MVVHIDLFELKMDNNVPFSHPRKRLIVGAGVSVKSLSNNDELGIRA